MSRCGTGVVERGTADLLKSLRALARGKHDDFSVAVEAGKEIERLQQVCRRVYEVWAGSEGIPAPETAAEAYLLSLVERMRDEAKEGLA